ncbi:hypothetical protein F4781DRAFT_71556 [Annulohypoxylon bovei var. microspora]|nr:hypothetical protein F4781DRAFT_71556 [Annulohypoxylon bovei var. microspora]
MNLGIPQVFTQKGWRRTGFINVILTFTCGIILLVCLIISLKRPGSYFNGTTIIYEGSCNDVSKLNDALHLFLNLLATGVLASSNFFMQVVASPSREEIDKAHAFLYSLDIGILSIKNIRFISYFKRTFWLGLLLSSLPIHIFFNSSVFKTTYQGSNWHLTIATEAFTQGGDFFPPGASLAPAGSPSPGCKYHGGEYGIDGYGEAVPLELYANKTSVVRQDINNTAASGSNWTKLDANTCRNEYTLCASKTKYRDVVVVIESGADDPRGWRREEVFNLTHNISLQWDIYVPQNKVNSLWYSTQCETSTYVDSQLHCRQTCGDAFGLYDGINVPTNVTASSTWTFTFQSLSATDLPNEWTGYGYNDKFSDLTVKYCLAEPNPNGCKIGLSNLFLFVVIICIFTKAIQCSIILWKLPRSSLVTLGDAMESFISKPDSRTTGLGTLDILDSIQLETQPRHYWIPENRTLLTPTIRPRRWLLTTRRFLSSIPQIAWARTYILLLLSFIALVVFLGISYVSNNYSFEGSFGQSQDNIQSSFIGNNGYLTALIIANIPQLILSLCYFSYNGFFTRLLNEHEWNSYSRQFQPLRVSYPVGKQISSYRLQLPYKYSIPLISFSVLLHWFLSNALFLLIIDGGMLLGRNWSS